MSELTRHMVYNLSSLHYTYSIGVIAFINNYFSSPLVGSQMTTNAMNAATKKHIAHDEISTPL